MWFNWLFVTRYTRWDIHDKVQDLYTWNNLEDLTALHESYQKMVIYRAYL